VIRPLTRYYDSPTYGTTEGCVVTGSRLAGMEGLDGIGLPPPWHSPKAQDSNSFLGDTRVRRTGLEQDVVLRSRAS
jgi:hypothetical protein